MTPTEEAALEIVSKTACLIEEVANTTKDDALLIYAERGTRCISSDSTTAAEMLNVIWPIAHVVNVRLGVLQKGGLLTAQQYLKTIEFCGRLNRYIREALYLTKPDEYAFLAPETDPKRSTP
jgi:hypothetical protein